MPGVGRHVAMGTIREPGLSRPKLGKMKMISYQSVKLLQLNVGEWGVLYKVFWYAFFKLTNTQIDHFYGLHFMQECACCAKLMLVVTSLRVLGGGPDVCLKRSILNFRNKQFSLSSSGFLHT